MTAIFFRATGRTGAVQAMPMEAHTSLNDSRQPRTGITGSTRHDADRPFFFTPPVTPSAAERDLIGAVA